MKLLVFSLTFTVFLIGLTSSANITWGAVGPYDVLLHYDIVKKSSSLFHVVTLDVTYPGPYQYNNRTITGIRVTDQILNEKGGFAQLFSGGPGFSHVTVHFKSQRGKSFSFILEIYGLK